MLKVAADPSDLQVKFDLASLYVEKGKLEQSSGLLLELIGQNKNWENKKAQTLLLEVFKKLGNEHETTKKGRKKLATLLF